MTVRGHVQVGAPLANPLWGPDWPAVRALWALDPSRAHLNHGSFGAVPRDVQDRLEDIRRAIEANPSRFFWREMDDRVEEARRHAAAFLGADPAGFVFVRNATTGASTVLAAVDLRPGDELLVTNQTYGAVRLAAERACHRSGAKLVVQAISWPQVGPGGIREAFLAGVTDRTRLAVVDHIASPTGLVFPVGELVTALRRRGVPSLVDGAHAPGMVSVDLQTLDPDFWIGVFHKWCCAPMGSGALHVREEYRARVAPIVTSWRYGKPFVESFSLLGTDDYSAYLAIGAALTFMERLGWDRVREHNRSLARFGQRAVAGSLRMLEETPTADELFGAMRPVALPSGVATTEEEARMLHARIAHELNLETAVVAWEGRGYIRLSAQAYNAPAEYERLAEGLPGLLGRPA